MPLDHAIKNIQNAKFYVVYIFYHNKNLITSKNVNHNWIPITHI